MRVTRSFLLLLAVALCIAGCATQPVAYAPAAPAPATIDTMTYGAPAPAYRAGYAAPVAANCTGFFTCAYPAAPVVAPRYAAPAPAVMAAPVAVAAPAVVPAPFPVIAPQQGYTLDSGDRLRIVVFGQDGLTNSYLVDASGHIAMPLIGTVLAKGLTTDQLSARIAAALREGFIREPHVAVEVEAYRPFFILGEVTAPGQYPYVANMTAETAIAIAGGFAPSAVRQSVILNRTVNGVPMRMSVPLTFPLRPGDTINVQERWF